MVFTVDMPEPVRRSPGKLWRQIRDVLETLIYSYKRNKNVL